ncbi:MAG: hypothetical protein Q8L48_03165 [Archangium sp.]|nr:hypothetical protein [Archangium sp.]
MKSILLVSVIAVAGCTTPTSVSSPSPTKGKPSAPVAVSGELTATSARLRVSFEAAAENVEIVVSGIDGLVVEGEGALVKKGTFTRGESKDFDVKFTAPPAGRSQLVLSVSGSFNGASRARVASFTVGTGPLPESGTVMTTDDGERVKVMPAETPK